MDNEKKIWVDITSIFIWRQQSIGIIRVEKAIAQQLLVLGEEYNVNYCRFEQAHNRYVELDYNEVRQILSRPVIEIEPIPNRNELQTITVPDISVSLCANKVEALRSISKGIASLLPSSLQKIFISLVYHAYKFALICLAALKRLNLHNIWTKSDLKISKYGLTLPKIPLHPFHNGDVLISLGLDWEHKDMLALSFMHQNFGLRIAGCCYDVIPILFPQYSPTYYTKYLSYIINLAWASDIIFCVSKRTRDDLERVLHTHGCRLPLLEFLHLSINHLKLEESPTEKITKILNKRFILYVSTIERRKNHEVLYRAYTRLIDNGIDQLALLVFVGNIGWGVKELLNDIALDNRTKNLIAIFDYVGDSDLVHLYKKSLFCVFPSLYEGWGLPVTEALSFGKFVICSNRGSLPEAGGEFVDYVDPWDVNGWSEAMLKYMRDSEALQIREMKIKQDYVNKGDWKDTAKSMLTSIESSLKSIP